MAHYPSSKLLLSVILCPHAIVMELLRRKKEREEGRGTGGGAERRREGRKREENKALKFWGVLPRTRTLEVLHVIS